MQYLLWIQLIYKKNLKKQLRTLFLYYIFIFIDAGQVQAAFYRNLTFIWICLFCWLVYWPMYIVKLKRQFSLFVIFHHVICLLINWMLSLRVFVIVFTHFCILIFYAYLMRQLPKREIATSIRHTCLFFKCFCECKQIFKTISCSRCKTHIK